MLRCQPAKELIALQIGLIEPSGSMLHSRGIARIAQLQRLCQDLGLNLVGARKRNKSNLRVLVIHIQEDWAIAKECLHLLRGGTTYLYS